MKPQPSKINAFAAVLLGLVLMMPVGTSAAVGTIDAVHKYAWSEDGGWLNFDTTNSNVVINDTTITGYVWSENYGWIDLAPTNGGVTNTTGGDVGGYAWGENTGYIDFSGVSINSSGEFIGYATNSVLGQISFNCLNTASCGSSDFKVKTDWLPVAGSPGSSIQRLQSFQTSISPVSGLVDVLGVDTVQYHWTYDGNNAEGFRVLLPATHTILVQVDDPLARTAREIDLPPNSLVSGRSVVAFASTNESLPSSPFPDVYTLVTDVAPELVSRSNQSISVRTQATVPNLSEGQTGVQFQLLAVDSTTGDTMVTSEWLKTDTYRFYANTQGIRYQLRARARNQAGVETSWSSPVDIGDQNSPSQEVELIVDLHLTSAMGKGISSALNPNDILYGSISISNNGESTARNVLLTLPIPNYIQYIPGTLSVDGRSQSDSADPGTGQVTNGALSVVWADLPYALGHIVRFQLAFDTEALLRDFITIPTDAELRTALATVNPSITLQAQASHQGDPNPSYSNPQQVEPDLSVFGLQETTPDDFVSPTPEEVDVIETVLEGQFPNNNVTNNAPTIPQGDTDSNFTGGSFNVDTINGNDQLSLQGYANTEGGSIVFTGTTSQPFSVVTLILNGSTTIIVTSDANGNWQTFVSAEQLGLRAGDQATITAEIIATNGSLQSERVQISEVFVSRAADGDLVADFGTQTSENNALTTFRRASEAFETAVEAYEPELKTTLTVSAPVVILSSAPLWGYIPYVPTLIYHFIGWLVGAVGRRKKDQDHESFGVVYDAISKLPLPLAIVRIYNDVTNKLAATIVTDKLGRFDALLAPGHYRVEVAKPEYQYPSSIVTTRVDASFSRVYNKQAGLAVTEQTLSLPHVPIDPVNAKRQWELSFGFKKLWLAFQRLGGHLATPILLVGFISGVALVYAIPSKPSSWIIAGVYAITLAAQVKLKPKLIKAWGVVYDVASNAILPLVTIQLIEPETSKVVTSRLSDYEGRFTFLPEPGTYVVKASKPGFTQVTEVVQTPFKQRQPISEMIDIKKPNQRVSGDVAMKQGV